MKPPSDNSPLLFQHVSPSAITIISTIELQLVVEGKFGAPTKKWPEHTEISVNVDPFLYYVRVPFQSRVHKVASEINKMDFGDGT
jgi:hypothetical protein